MPHGADGPPRAYRLPAVSNNGFKPVDHEVAVVGAGLTGICAGIKLGEAIADWSALGG